jgi:MoxR-like ATPase
MQQVKAGRPAIEIGKLCYHANRPFLLIGHYGIGKSAMVEDMAAQLGIGFISCDLSLMEPPDLVGLPKPEEERTTYLPPKFLPTDGAGILIFEELNRCAQYMRSPCLQLLTARRLNDYQLPHRWLPVAAINPPAAGFDVADLDQALLSRFVQVNLVPDRDEWLHWARQNGIHAAVIRYVDSDPSVFDQPESNPRAWSYVSDLLRAAEERAVDSFSLETAIVGVVGTTRGEAFLRTLADSERPPSAETILDAYCQSRRQFLVWHDRGRTDLWQATLLAIMKYLQPEDDFAGVRRDRERWANLRAFLYDLPPDLLAQGKDFFAERGYEFPRRLKK